MAILSALSHSIWPAMAILDMGSNAPSALTSSASSVAPVSQQRSGVLAALP
jgi:hypothetical protein